MTNHELPIRHFLLMPALLALAMTLSLGPVVLAQTPMSQRNDSDVTRGQLASFDRFMDSHPEIAEQLRKDPSLMKNEEFVENHPALREYMRQHPEVREEISENPSGFLHQEERFDRREDQASQRRDDDVTRRELANFDRFMDSHPEIAEQLRKDPSLAKNKEFVENHPALREYMQQHPEVREEISENPSSFLHQEERFDRREGQPSQRRDDDVTRRELSNFDRFMDSHPEVAEQLRKDPSLVKNKEFVENHPALQEYMQQHPEVREEISEHPNGFVHQEERFDRREDWREGHGDHDFDRAEAKGFGHFLGDHSGVASQLSRNPSLANNEEFVESHPDLQQYLKEHPGAQKQLAANPQNFLQSAQQFTNSTAAPKTPILNPQPKLQK